MAKFARPCSCIVARPPISGEANGGSLQHPIATIAQEFRPDDGGSGSCRVIRKSYVWELENREVPHLSAKVLIDLAKALEVTIHDLLGEPPPVKASPDDLRFFRKYINMDKADKERLRKMVDLFEQPAANGVRRR